MAKETKKNVQPLADRVLVKREDKEVKKSAGGIIIPDTAQKKESKIGIVIAVGPGRTNDEGKLVPISVKPGSKVIFKAGWDNEVELGDEEGYFLVEEKDILAVIK